MLTPEQINDVIKQFDREPTTTNVQQLGFTLEAFEVFLERNSVYQDLWASHTAEEKVEHMEHKLARVKQLLKLIKAEKAGSIPHDTLLDKLLDSLLDLINYAVFCGRLSAGLVP